MLFTDSLIAVYHATVPPANCSWISRRLHDVEGWSADGANGGAPSPADGLNTIYAELFDIVTNAVPESICWDNGPCDLSLLCLAGADTSAQRQCMRRYLGVPHLEWLPYAEVKYVLTWNGPPAMSFPASITAPGILLRDVLRWTHIRTGRIAFHKQRPISDDAARRLIVALLTNFPELVFAPSLQASRLVMNCASLLNHGTTLSVFAPLGRG